MLEPTMDRYGLIQNLPKSWGIKIVQLDWHWDYTNHLDSCIELGDRSKGGRPGGTALLCALVSDRSICLQW